MMVASAEARIQFQKLAATSLSLPRRSYLPHNAVPRRATGCASVRLKNNVRMLYRFKRLHVTPICPTGVATELSSLVLRHAVWGC